VTADGRVQLYPQAAGAQPRIAGSATKTIDLLSDPEAVLTGTAGLAVTVRIQITCGTTAGPTQPGSDYKGYAPIRRTVLHLPATIPIGFPREAPQLRSCPTTVTATIGPNARGHVHVAIISR
jgi:hypothetical protein